MLNRVEIVFAKIYTYSHIQTHISFSMLCSLFVCGCVAYRSINADMGGPIRMSHNPIKLYPGSTREFLTCVAIIEVTFTCHMNVLPMHDELRKQTTRNKRVIIVISMCIAYLASFVISLFGYFQVSVKFRGSCFTMGGGWLSWRFESPFQCRTPPKKIYKTFLPSL